MKINNTNQNYNCIFLANINSPKLNFSQKDFFVRIRGYGKNPFWADKTKATADTATNLIRKNTSFENILKIITTGIRNANKLVTDIQKSMHSGILRTEREGWLHGSWWDNYTLCTNYSHTARYKLYKDRLDNTIKKPLHNPYKNIQLTIPVIDKKEHFLLHADSNYVNNALNLVSKKYSNFKQKFNSENVNQSQLNEINDNIAEIRWILAHSTPWERGSDAISNVLMRAMYKSIGIKSYPLKKNISLDLEAFCTELEDYKKNFSNYFELPPKIID